MQKAVVTRVSGGGQLLFKAIKPYPCFWQNSIKCTVSMGTVIFIMKSVIIKYREKHGGFMKKRAFTLAEVLITLGIIGVVAAMTLPALINNSNNRQFEAALKKNYSIIQQAFAMYAAENGTVLRDKEIPERQLKPMILKYFKVLHDCGNGENDPDACIPNFGQSSELTSNEYKTYNNKDMDVYFFDDGQFVLPDGSLILIKNNLLGDHVYISVDVNGHKKKPNRWGHDLFTFQLMSDGKILPMGAEGTKREDLSTFCSSSSSDPLNGISCAYKAFTDKDYFKNLPK